MTWITININGSFKHGRCYTLCDQVGGELYRYRDVYDATKLRSQLPPPITKNECMKMARDTVPEYIKQAMPDGKLHVVGEMNAKTALFPKSWFVRTSMTKELGKRQML